MGKSEYSIGKTVAGSDSGYGDDIIDRLLSSAGSSVHPLSRKGYEIGPASKLQIGDVFEFLWADCPEFEWEWKCLGYSRFIVLRHSDSFPHYCACVPISTGGRRDFAKPGIDTLQQGYVYASGERDRDRDGADAQTPNQQHKNLPQLPYSSVGIHLRSGRHRVKDDSRANYADIIEVDHEAQVMVIGDVAKYFDRVRKNVNKAFMRQVLRDALGPYCERKKSESAAAGVKGWGNSAVSLAKVTQNQHPVQRDENISPDDTEAAAATAAAAADARQAEDLQTDGGAHILGRDEGESIMSDTTKDDDEDWDRSQQTSPVYTTSAVHPPDRDERRDREERRDRDERRDHDDRRERDDRRDRDERRARRAASRASTRLPEQSGGMPVRAGMDRAGLASLRNLRQSLPGGGGGDDYDDTRSLRSLAMVGRSDSNMSRRSGR